MENSEPLSGGASLDNKGFINSVFNFDKESKSELINVLQYSLLSILPVIVLNKTVHKYIPEADENKGTLEILAEVVVQIIVMFSGITLIHRIVSYIPTYSEVNYDKFNLTNVILVFMMLMLSLQTKLGEKINILLERLTDVWDGSSSLKNENNQSKVKITQPGITNPLQPRNLREGMAPNLQNPGSVGGNDMGGVQMQQLHQVDNTIDTRILPTGGPGPNPVQFDGMYQQDGMGAEPMAANSFGSLF